MKALAFVGFILVGVSTVSFHACSNQAGDAGGATAGAARKILYYRDPMHPSYTSPVPGKAPDCGMDLEPVYTADAGTITVGAGQQGLIGIRLGRVTAGRTTGTFQTLGRVAYDENRVFPVRTGCDGMVTRVFPGAATGDSVRKGQPLASVYGRDFTTAQRSFLYALYASENPPPVRPGEDASQPVLTLQEARLLLANVGIGDAQIRSLTETRRVMLDIQVEAPADGVVVTRNVSPQQRFEKDVELFRIADLRHVWIIADLLGDDQALVLPGDTARVSVPGGSGPALTAKVSAALPRFDGGSRALKVRLEADNPHRTLSPDMFVDLAFPVALPEATTVPAESVVGSGPDAAVYVAGEGGAFTRRAVTTGWRFNGRVQILSGVSAGESIVVSGNALLEAESRMRRGDVGRHD